MRRTRSTTHIGRSLGRIAGISLAAMLFAVLQPGAAEAGRGFLVTSDTGQELVGILEEGSADAAFESRMETPRRVSLQVRVKDLVLDSSAELEDDGRKRAVVIDGHGMALSAEDKETLILLSRELQRRLRPDRRDLPPHEDLLLRMVLYWAEAPVGFPIGRREVSPGGSQP